ncbi:hypothetical protein D3C72_2218210 [compost metagenome]
MSTLIVAPAVLQSNVLVICGVALISVPTTILATVAVQLLLSVTTTACVPTPTFVKVLFVTPGAPSKL